jgi:hypothetical protein
MKYAVIDDVAVDELVANRFLQSVEFEQGRSLLALLRGELRSADIAAGVRVTRMGDGLFITGQTVSTASKFVVIDEEQAGMFRQQTAADALFSFQKLLRFAKKLWQGLSLTFAERMISGSSKAVIFPYRYKPVPFRIVIEREPMADRLAKRGQGGNWLLVYKVGHETGDANREQAGLTNFRKAVEAVPDLRKALADQAVKNLNGNGEIAIDQMQVTQLSPASQASFGTTSLYRRFEDWLPLLTEQQTKFVTSPITKPMRIEGAAGTGKTLALILKAVHALREAKRAGQPCHLVFVTHSDARSEPSKRSLPLSTEMASFFRIAASQLSL